MAWTTKTTRTYAWDAGARSIASLPGNGAFSFSVGQSTGIVCGLNETNLGVDYREIDHAFWIEGNKYRIIESGVFRTTLANFTPDAVFRIERFEGEVQYFVDDVWVFTSTVESTGTVFLDASLIAYDDTILDATCIEDYRYFSSILLPNPMLVTGEECENYTLLKGVLLPDPFIVNGEIDENYSISNKTLLPGPLIVTIEDDEGHALFKGFFASGVVDGDDQFGGAQLKLVLANGSSDEVSENILINHIFTSGEAGEISADILINQIFISGESDDLGVDVLMSSFLVYGEDVDVNEGTVLLGLPIINGGTDDLNYGQVLFSLPLLTITNDLAFPDIAVGEIQLAPLFVRGTSEIASANLLLNAIIANGSDSDNHGGAILSAPITYGTTQVAGYFSALCGQFSLVLVVPAPLQFKKVFQFGFQHRKEITFNTTYSLNTDLVNIYEFYYDLSTMDSIKSSFEIKYRDSIQKNSQFLYEDCLKIKTTQSLFYIDFSSINKLQELMYADFSSIKKLQELMYADFSSINKLQEFNYADFSSIQKLQEFNYADFSSIQKLQEFNYADFSSIKKLQELMYADFSSINKLQEFNYADFSSINKSQELVYSDFSSINKLQELVYSDFSSIQKLQEFNYADFSSINKLQELVYSDFSSINKLQEFNYADFSSINKLQELSYADFSSIKKLQELMYADFSSIQKLQEFNYADFSSIQKLQEFNYADFSSIQKLQEFNYADFSSINKLQELVYSDFSSIKKLQELMYADFSSINKSQELNYADKSSIQAYHVLNYEGLDLAPVFSFTYGLLTSCERVFSTGYKSESENIRSVFNTSYALNNEDVILLSGSCWIELNGQVIYINEVSINADESSSYYQCSATLLNEVDYHKFTVDTLFIVHLFDNVYHFLIDSKNLSRSIDGEGNLTTEMVIEGLSPIVRYAAPRSLAITKTWDSPTLLSGFIEELIGTVDYQVVDDFVPAYRLSANNAIPLELAKATMESIGALIESLPDGSIKVRKLWPININLLNDSVADHTLNDDQLFAMSENPDNNDLRNQFRLIDVDSTVQDTLEFVKDEDNDLAGTLYAYPSPWRDNLSLRHTRGLPIYLGPLTEELVEITVNSDSEIEVELLEFLENSASTRYPVETLLSLTWLAADLGAVAFVPHTKNLQASAGDGYSLAEVRYTSRRLKARTSSSEYTSAQYLLEEF